MTHSTITRLQVADKLRIQHTADLFGIRFPLNIEPAIYSIASNIATEYNGAYWEFYSLSNGGFYMAPCSDQSYQVSCDNGYEGKLSPDALGITACLYAYSHLSFSSNQAFAEICANHYHWLRAYMLEHKEASAILSAID
ncbi:MAG: antirestriction protein [Methylotenera sp.]|uniref:antirestriction protein n=1 Tax=Methylotenera sp. TaxID=2051956 RepID=UPI002732CAA2|nr:antirestriction protein [Methylotenera sp.]MDP2102106.1 antirestriction protein [Methylotenera sp.]MDP2281066.1 antirestriction protein [Methylotenera sp.]MDP3061161.1 antirestriction protein [Methylotenera sp.]MDP3210931.1 antirestriction protein [Methylotenera sp.]